MTDKTYKVNQPASGVTGDELAITYRDARKTLMELAELQPLRLSMDGSNMTDKTYEIGRPALEITGDELAIAYDDARKTLMELAELHPIRFEHVPSKQRQGLLRGIQELTARFSELYRSK